MLCSLTLVEWAHVATIALSILSLATLCFLVWYTRETQKLRKIAQEQTDMMALPIPILKMPTREHADEYLFALQNLGKGPAFNLCLSDIIGEGIRITFRPPLVLPDDRSIAPCDWSCFINEKETDPDTDILSAAIDAGHIKDEFELTLRYENLRRKQYQIIHKVRWDTYCGFVPSTVRIQPLGVAESMSPGTSTQ